MTRRRTVSWAGTLLLLGGVGILIGVGASYATSARSAASGHTWSLVQSRQAQELTRLVNYQNKNFFRVRRGHHGSILGEPAIRIRIPAIGVDSPIIETGVVGGVWQVADWSVGYLQGSPYPGACVQVAGQQNCSTDVAAHDDIKGEIFKRLGDLKPGNKVYVYTPRAVFTYVVNGQQAVSPTDGTVLSSPSREITMITCIPYWVDSERLVVTALLKGEQARPNPAAHGSHF